jgi:hypothetical protein
MLESGEDVRWYVFALLGSLNLLCFAAALLIDLRKLELVSLAYNPNGMPLKGFGVIGLFLNLCMLTYYLYLIPDELTNTIHLAFNESFFDALFFSRANWVVGR